jgi:hypothetical protein
VAAPRLSREAQAALARARETGDETGLETLRATGELPAPLVQAGSFAVRAGALAAPAEEEPGRRPALAPRTAPGEPALSLRDFVIADDLIVQGSTCVGFDCVNGEAFSFDTVRLKENSTRLTFIDTSAAGFPQGDWQLRANDSAGGGANEFTVDWLGTGAVDGDTPTTTPLVIEGGASNNSIYVDSTGRVGLRTSTPVLDLHVATSNTPAIRLEQNNSGGFTAQTWDIAGNEASFFVRDVTGGSRLPFRIRPGAPTSAVDISADGDVGIGDASPDDRLDVEVSAANGGVRIESTVDGILPQLTLIEPTRTWRFRVVNNGNFVFTDATSGWEPFRIVGNAGANDRLVISAGGVDVIGALTVNGIAMIVPDYVFEPDYRLMPLEDLAAFVAENRHLPGVPTASEVKAKGLDLSSFPLQLLEKVEELTLYTLAQHETIEQLAGENAELAAHNAALERRLVAIEAALGSNRE